VGKTINPWMGNYQMGTSWGLTHFFNRVEKCDRDSASLIVLIFSDTILAYPFDFTLSSGVGLVLVQ